MKILVLLALISASRSFSFFPSSRRHGQPVFPSSTSSVPTSRSLRPCGASALFAEEGGGGGGEMDRERQGKSKVLTKVKEKVEAKAKEKIKNEGMWRVLLHNDEIHTFDYVTHSIVKVVKQLSRKKAHQITVQTHSAGQASVIIVWKALAETYCLGLQRQGLTASIAPDSGFKKNDDNGGGGPDTDGGS